MELVTRFDNAGRLTTVRVPREGRGGGEPEAAAQARRSSSFSQVTPPTPAAPRPLQQPDAVLFGVLLSLEVLAMPAPEVSGAGGIQQTGPVVAVVWSLRDERVRGLLAQRRGGDLYADAHGAICVGPPVVGLDASVAVQAVPSEAALFDALAALFRTTDPAVVLGYDVIRGSVGLLLQRAAALGLAPRMARAAKGEAQEGFGMEGDDHADHGATQADAGGAAGDPGAKRRLYPPELVSGGVDLPGRLVLNVWRVLRGEAKLQTSSVQTAAAELLGETLPLVPARVLSEWWATGGPRARVEALRLLLRGCACNLRLLDALNVLPRAAETARMLGIDVLSVLSRGSQYRVEGMLLRAAHRDRALLFTPSRGQVASQRGAECIPLVMEPKSAFYFDPVVVLDFQSLYPSIIIAYNICFATCLGRLYYVILHYAMLYHMDININITLYCIVYYLY